MINLPIKRALISVSDKSGLIERAKKLSEMGVELLSTGGTKKAIAEARAHGDLSENAEYHSAKERQGWIESQILNLEDKYTRAQVIDVAKLDGDTVKFGATVTLIDDETEEEKSLDASKPRGQRIHQPTRIFPPRTLYIPAA